MALAEDQYRQYTQGVTGTGAKTLTFDQWSQKTGLGKQTQPEGYGQADFTMMQRPDGSKEMVPTRYTGNSARS